MPKTSIPEGNKNDTSTLTPENGKIPIIGDGCCECNTVRSGTSKVTFINLDRRKTSGFATTAGFLGRSIGSSDRILSADVNGDGKTDILLFTSRRVYAYTLNKTNSLQLLWQTNSNYIKNNLPIFLGDYNGDGKTDFMTPTANGSSVFNTFISTGANFLATSDTFTFTFNVSHSAGDTAHGYNLFPVDINGDGKTDIIEYITTTFNGDPANGKQTVAIHRNYYSSDTTKELKFSKGGQKTQKGNLYHFPVPIFLSSDQPNYALEFATISNKYIHSFKQTQDHREEVTLRSITNNGVSNSIYYSNLDPQDNVNGVIYTKGNSQVYPYVDIATASGIKLVRRIQRNGGNGITTIKKDFYYHGAVSHMGGLGFSGFQKVARSNWHTGRGDRIYTNFNFDIALRRAVIDEYKTPYDYRFNIIPSDYITKTKNVYEHSLSGRKVWKMKMTSSTTQNQLDGTNTSQHFLYDGYNNPTKETINFSGHGSKVTELTYSNSTSGSYYIGRQTKRKFTSTIKGNSFSSEERYTYAGGLLTTKKTKGNGTQFDTETYEYDSYGNNIKVTVTPYGFYSRTSTSKYDATARFVKVFTNSEGLQTFADYDPNTGMMTKEQNPYLLSTKYSYDKWNRISKVTDYLGNDVTTSYTESSHKYTVTANAADGSSASSMFDPLGRKVNDRKRTLGGQWVQVSYEYDKLDRPSRQSEPHFGNAPAQWSTNEYDLYGRIKRQTLNTGKVINYSYNGLSVTVNDGAKSSTTTRDALGNTVRVDDPGGTITYTYFGNGNMKSTSYAGISQTVEQDGWGQKTKLTDPSAGVYTYTYNPYGEVTKETTPKGSTSNSYLPTGRIQRTKVSGDHTDMTTNYTYDNVTKQLTGMTATDAVNSRTYTYKYEYDTYKRPSSVSENTGTAQFYKKYLYDQYGRLQVEIYDARTAGKKSESLFAYTFDNYGASTGITDWKIKSQNAREQITSIELGTKAEEKMQYDTYGFLAKHTVSEKNVNANHIDNTYKFNPTRGTLTSRTHKTSVSGHSASYTESFQYDTQDRLTKINGPFAKTNVYDNSGRITSNSKIGSFAYQGGSKRYQLKEMTLNTAGSQFYKNRARQQITYNAFKKPVDIYEQGKGRVNFEYGPTGNRTNAWYGGSQSDKNQRRYHKQYSSIMPAEIIHDKQKSSYKFIFFNGGDAYDAPLAKIEKITNTTSDGGAMYQLQRDYQGSIINITKQVKTGNVTSGILQERRQFGAWGTVDAFWSRTSGATLGSESLLDRGYTGHEHFEDVGLIHMNGRMYDPQLGRFLSPDNYIQNPYNTQNFNRYGYVLNNPLMYTDPSGEIIETVAATGIYYAIAGAIMAASVLAEKWDDWGIGNWLGTNADSIARDFNRAVDDIKDWVDGWFGKAPEKIEFAQTQVMSDPLMNPNPGVSSLLTSNGGSGYITGIPIANRQIDTISANPETWAERWQRGNFVQASVYSVVNAFSIVGQSMNPFDDQVTSLAGEGLDGTDRGAYGAEVAATLLPIGAGTGAVARSVTAKIIGRAQATGTRGHAFFSKVLAYAHALNPRVARVSLDLGYRRLLGNLTPNGLRYGPRPDVGVLYKSGRVRAIEIGSKTDDLIKLMTKNSDFLTRFKIKNSVRVYSAARWLNRLWAK